MHFSARIWLTGVLAGAAWSPAQAHAVLVDSQPAAAATVPAGMVALRLRYNSRIDRARSRISLLHAGAADTVLLIGDDDRFGEPQDTQWDSLGDDAGRRAGSALAGLAASRGIGSSRILVPAAPPLVRFAAASATGDFAATYLALARGIDPSAPRLGELPH